MKLKPDFDIKSCRSWWEQKSSWCGKSDSYFHLNNLKVGCAEWTSHRVMRVGNHCSRHHVTERDSLPTEVVTLRTTTVRTSQSGRRLWNILIASQPMSTSRWKMQGDIYRHARKRNTGGDDSSVFRVHYRLQTQWMREGNCLGGCMPSRRLKNEITTRRINQR